MHHFHADLIPRESAYPEMRQPPNSATVTEGSNVRFSAMISGTPQPVVNWYVNGIRVQPPQPGEEEPRVMQTFDGLLHHFELKQCRVEESGQVTVEALRGDVPEDVARSEPNRVIIATAGLEVIPAPGKFPQLRAIPRKSI